MLTNDSGKRTALIASLSRRLGELVDRLQVSPELIFMGTALLVGLMTGVGAVAFRWLIAFVARIGYEWVPAATASLGVSYVVYVPALGGLLVGLLVYYFAREAKGHGVPEVMEAVALRGGRIRPIVAVVKSLASSICIGSGGSVGREGPIVQIGSALGSTIGQLLKLSDDRISNLVACGAAGGIAATFNAPIAGVMFALEVILGGRFGVRYFSSVVVSAVAASVVGRVVLGDVPAFAIPFEYGIASLWEFALYPVLGVLAAFVGVAFTWLLYRAEDLFDAWRRPPEWLKPAIGGVLLGVLALLYPPLTGVTWQRMPQIYNVGYEVIEQVLANRMVLTAAATLLVLKVLATSLTLGSGGSGGIFAPSLFMGAMLGGAFAIATDHLIPGLSLTPGAYALVGMAAVFSAAAHAPVTAVVILFELTSDYRIILPLMLTVAVATVLAQHVMRGESIYTLKLSRRGIKIRHGRDVDILDGVLVQEVMEHRIPTVPQDATLAELHDIFFRTHHHGVVVVDGRGELLGITTLQDLERAMQREGWEKTPVTRIMTTQVLTAYPDETIGTALRRIALRDVGRLPVVSRENPRKLLGLVRRTDIARAYQRGILRQNDLRDRAQQMRISREAGGTQMVELRVHPGSRVANKRVRDLKLPQECLLTTRRHDERMHLLHGDDVLEVGDIVLALCEPGKVRELRALFEGEP
ncbi:MAG: CBS domain-containing protein [Caldilineae bacterium]|nr:MAG: CBS domain-containing protein [Caldilineae bacterium]